MDSFYESNIDWKNPTQLEKTLITKYKFTQTNIESYFVNKEYRLNDLELKIRSTIQLSLRNGRSTIYRSDKIHVMYEFDNVYIISNDIDYYEEDEKDLSVGAEFDFQNLIETEKDKIINIGFDIYDVTGVLFKK